LLRFKLNYLIKIYHPGMVLGMVVVRGNR
jgi:hypothetical protein